MKRFFILALAVLMIVPFCACSDDGYGNYPTKTSAFYGTMNHDEFWFEMTYTDKSGSFNMIQATNGKNVTTIIDREGKVNDEYSINVGDAVHTLDLEKKKYDTLITEKGQVFLFSDYDASMFTNPRSVDEEKFDGKTYHCETYTTTSYTGESLSGQNKYYFDGNELVAIEIIENGEKMITMRMKDYANSIPSNIYVEIPSGFKAGTLASEYDIDYKDYWG